jgi:hypothetical protein
MDNFQKHNICTNVPSSQTFSSYLQSAAFGNCFLQNIPVNKVPGQGYTRTGTRTGARIFILPTHPDPLYGPAGNQKTISPAVSTPEREADSLITSIYSLFYD